MVALAQLIHAIMGRGPCTSIGLFWDAQGQPGRIMAAKVRAAVRASVDLDGLEAKGCNANQVGSHSLQSGGAIALKLAIYDEATIKKLGRWSSNTYLIYIQNQISQLTVGVATAMGQTLRWHHMG